MVNEIIQQSEVQLLFNAGVLEKAVVVKSPLLDKNYELLFQGKKKQQYVFASLRKQNEPRLFKSFDGAINMAERIGFKKVEINL